MERLTHKRENGIKRGYWSPNKKQELVDRLAMYEDREDAKDTNVPGKWIPCSERLPENAMNVIAQFSSGTVTELRYAGNGIFEGIYEYSTKVIIAWMPLPEPYKLRMWCDSAEPDRIKMWQKAGYRAKGVNKETNSVHAQIDYLKQHMIHIHPSCVNTIKEIQQWKWKKDERTNTYLEEPVPFFDDAMAMLRYSIEEERKAKPKLNRNLKGGL